MRVLVLMLTLILTFTMSGISSAAIATSTGDDCCGAAAQAEDLGTSGVDPFDSDGHNDRGRDKCPPLCHKCACSPTFAVPRPLTTAPIAVSADSWITFDDPTQLPVDPPRAGVFHPPRLAA